MASRTVAVLSTITAPLLPLLLRALYDRGTDDVVVVLDRRALGPKDLGIFQERTQGAFDDVGVSLYDFAERGLVFHMVDSHNGADCLALLRRIAPALLINGGTPRKLKPEILALPRQGVVNVHPGILPKYRGSSCVEWAILNDDPVGNTAHFMTEGYDEGPILAIEPTVIAAGADYPAIRIATYRQSLDLMARTVARLLDEGTTIADLPPQPEGSFFTPVSADDMAEVVRKAAEGRYRPAAAA